MLYVLKGQNKKEDFLAEIFENRGISASQSLAYLNTTDAVVNKSSNLENIDLAVQMVKRHLDNDSRIVIIVDSDVDGYTSSAIVWNFLKSIKPDVKLNYTNHTGKQHGLSADVFAELENYDLVLVPDAGSNDFEGHRILSEKGIDVLILDHHDAERYSEHALIVNSQLSENYDNKHLSGAGIAWQFIREMNSTFNLGKDVDYYLDLVGLGNVADMMSLTSFETKHLMTKGFKRVNNPFFQALVEKQDFSIKGEVNPMTVGWYIGPLINAMIRAGEQDEKNKMFEAMLEENRHVRLPSTKRGAKEGDTEGLGEYVARVCTNVRTKQNKMVEKGMELIDSIIKEKGLLDNKILIIPMPEDGIQAELIGLVANKITNIYKKPTAIVRAVGNDYGGSIRNFSNSPLEDFRGALEESGLINWARGHASAAGLSFPQENLDKLNNHFNELLKDHDMSQKYYVDFEFDMSKEGDADKLYECLTRIGLFNKQGLWGQDMAEPLIAVKNIMVSNNLTMNKTTMKITYKDIEYIKFKVDLSDTAELDAGFGAKNITIIGRASINEFAGRAKPQLMITDFAVNSSDEYYF